MATLATKHASKRPDSSITFRSRTPVVQRKCHCGGQCSSCQSKATKLEDSPYLQARLKVGPPDDKYEREADQAADRVMRKPQPILQRQVDSQDEEEELQMKANPAVLQRQEMEEVLQAKFTTIGTPAQLHGEVGEAANRTGMPDSLRSGLENLSGLDLSGVRVHYNSAKPAQINALAYTQGRDIHIAPGQEQHLPHEGWHVVQQMQGRVQPTIQAKRVPINDDAGLEREADRMGARTLQRRQVSQHASNIKVSDTFSPMIAYELTPSIQQAGNAQTIQRRTPTGSKALATAQGFNPLPGYLQEFNTCGTASLITAVIVRDKQAPYTGLPYRHLLDASSRIRDAFVAQRIGIVSRVNSTGTAAGKSGEDIHNFIFTELTLIIKQLKQGGAPTDGDYKVVSDALYLLFMTHTKHGQPDIMGIGMEPREVDDAFRFLQLGELATESQVQAGTATQETQTWVGHFDELWSEPLVVTLRPGQMIQIVGEVGEVAGLMPHAILMGRFADGRWFWSDQGPGLEIIGADAKDLQFLLEMEIDTKAYWWRKGSPMVLRLLTP